MRRISPIGWLLVVVGLLLLAVAVIYFTKTPPNLPAFLPGHITGKPGHKYTQKYSKRGIAAIVVAVGCFAGAYYHDMRS